MFTIQGPPYKHCDGQTRRQFLMAGALGLGGLTLADVLRAEAEQEVGSSNKSIINVHLDGGPSQMDTIDLKPHAPVEIRGEFRSVATRIAGFQVCELMPRLANAANKFSFIRSLVGAAGRHDAFQCLSGFGHRDMVSLGGRPAMGCVLSKIWGTSQGSAPAFVDLMQGRPLVRNSARPGYLGPSYKPFRPDISALFPRPLENGMKNELAALGANHTIPLALNATLDEQRLGERAALLRDLDGIHREMDASGMIEAMDRFHQQAADILTSGRVADALDLTKIDHWDLRRYTAATPNVHRFVTADDHRAMRKLLLARRLVEAGVRCVSVSFSDFDTHTKNFDRMRHMLPILDLGLHALIHDLEERGMLGDVSIVVWGEFGRTPKINNKGGRDHWPQVAPAILAGGGMRTGQVIGVTDRIAGAVTSRPIHYKDVFATLYRNMHIDPHRTTIIDPTGRPQYLLDAGEPIRELA